MVQDHPDIRDALKITDFFLQVLTHQSRAGDGECTKNIKHLIALGQVLFN